jgi:hypothetical protein
MIEVGDDPDDPSSVVVTVTVVAVASETTPTALRPLPLATGESGWGAALSEGDPTLARPFFGFFLRSATGVLVAELAIVLS